MPHTIDRDCAGNDDRGRGENALTERDVARLATYMSEGTFVFDGGDNFDFQPRRATVPDDLKVDFNVTRHRNSFDLELRVREVQSERAFHLGELGIDLIDRSNPQNPWSYARRVSSTCLTFSGLTPNHKYEFVFRGEEGGVAARLPPLPVFGEEQDAKRA